MSNGENANKSHRGKDWWGKRPLSCTGVSARGMKRYKKILHGIERAYNKIIIRKELIDHEQT
jgi:hypothetical protein